MTSPQRGAAAVQPSAGPTAIGISNLIYADASYDITEEVLKEVNKDRPAGAATGLGQASFVG